MHVLFDPDTFTLSRILAVIGLVLAPFGIAVLHMILTTSGDTSNIPEEDDEFCTFPYLLKGTSVRSALCRAIL